jgi:hypothetical protein
LPQSRRPWLALLAVLTAGVARAEVTADHAAFLADTTPHYAWAEPADGLSQPEGPGPRSGLLRVYVTNRGPEPVSVAAQSLDGVALEQLRTSERHEVIWWRTFPNPVPPGACAEVTVRLRYPLTADAHLGLTTGDQPLAVTIPVAPPPFRIETAGFAEGGRSVTLVAEAPLDAPAPARIARVLLDSEDVTSRCSVPPGGFAHGVCPVVVRPPEPLAVGSAHTYALVSEDGRAAAATLRTLSGVLRLDLYGATDLDEDVRLGINSLTHFHTPTRADLDAYARYGLVCAFHTGIPPAVELRGHPATRAYLLHDEPDCWDYTDGTAWPEGRRIGFHGQDMAQAYAGCVAADPVTPVMLTVDLTYKPANYLAYAQIADIVQPDCYPLTVGQSVDWVREIVDACRHAAGPRLTEFVAQVNWEDRGPDMLYKRPPFPREVWLEYLYALGSGARGFSGYEWYDEGNHHGARQYPEVLDAIGQAYRRLELVSPLVVQAHPMELAAAEGEDVWVRTLVCGQDALLLVVVNADHQCQPADFAHHPKADVGLGVPALPWLTPGFAAVVGDGEFHEVPLAAEADGARLRLPALDTGEIVLIARSGELGDALLARYRRLDTERMATLVRADRWRRKQAADERTAIRHIAGRYGAFVVAASASPSGYGVADPELWNPTGEQYNGIEWWTEAMPRGGEWRLTISPERAGVAHTVYFQMRQWWGGGHLRVELLGPDGALVSALEDPTWSGPVPSVALTFPAPGEYTIRLLDAGDGKPGGRLARCIYVVPDTAGPLPGPP